MTETAGLARPIRRTRRRGELDLGFELMARVTARLAVAIEPVLSEAGLTVDQWRVLTYLADDDGATMSELSAALSVTGPTLTRVVDRLATSALVHRNIDAEDRRRVLVHLSTRGAARVRELRPGVDDAQARVLDAVPAEERQAFVTVLRGMADVVHD